MIDWPHGMSCSSGSCGFPGGFAKGRSVYSTFGADNAFSRSAVAQVGTFRFRGGAQRRPTGSGRGLATAPGHEGTVRDRAEPGRENDAPSQGKKIGALRPGGLGWT